MRRRVRLGAMGGLGLLGAIIAFGASHCASATQIIVDVRTESSLCESISTGISVTSRDLIDKDPLEIYQEGCTGDDQVGTLTITPSGADDAWVGVRIVAATGDEANPDRCGRTDSDGKANWEDCILARRQLKFTPGETVHVTVRLTADCIGQYCGDDRECNLGQCVRPDQVQPDGGNSPNVDGGEESDGGRDSGPDDPCAFCIEPNGTCNREAGTCVVECNGGDCEGRVVCGGNLNCTITCNDSNDCSRTRCETTGTCTYNCNGAAPNQPRCVDIECRASRCNVGCSGADTTCNGVTMTADAGVINCVPAGPGRATCRDIVCNGGVCVRRCGDGGLGCAVNDQSQCTGNCTAFEDGGDGGR